jgi:hypothetical protein
MRILAVALIGVLACAAPAVSPLTFDVRPTMVGLRVDALNVARGLEGGTFEAAAASARRIEKAAIVPTGSPAPAEFVQFAEALRGSATFLRSALDGEDGPRARIALSQMFERCDACHERFRAKP